jgi:hypothetical protein
MSDNPTIRTNIENVPDSWSDADRAMVEALLTDIARSFAERVKNGESPEALVDQISERVAEEGGSNLDVTWENGEIHLDFRAGESP